MVEPVVFAVSLVLALVIGTLVGFFTVKVNFVLIILLGYLFSSGTAWGRYAVAGFLFSVVAFLLLGGQYPGLGLARFLLTAGFFGAFLLGVGIALASLAQGRETLTPVLNTIFPGGTDRLPRASEISSVLTAHSFLRSMPVSARKAIELFSALFNSATFVFLVSLRHGKLQGKRFTNLTASDQREYLDDWRRAPGLSYGAHIFRILANYSYYVKSMVWRPPSGHPGNDARVPYDGELLRRSYLK